METETKPVMIPRCPICGYGMKKEKMPKPRMILATNPLSTLLAKKIVVWYCEGCNKAGRA